MKTVLVTGANGFIGKALTKNMLSKGYKVYALVTSIEEMDDIRCDNLFVYKLFFEDYCKIHELIKEPIDVAYHFAWMGLNGKDAQDYSIQLKNVLASAILMNELVIIGVKKVVFASTMNTLELRKILNEPTKVKPRGVMIHVSSKVNAEIIARTIASNNNISFNVGLIAMSYGENNKSRMIPNVVIDSILNKKPVNLIEGNGLYDMVYIDDIVSAFVSIGEEGVDKESYYIGHDDNRTFKDIVVSIKNVLDKDAVLNFGVYKEENSLDYNLIDRSLLTKHTGWIPTADFDESIKKTAKWIKTSGIHFA